MVTLLITKQPKCPEIGKYLSDILCTLVTILSSHLNYIFINSGRVYIKVENRLHICFYSIITPMKN